MIDGEGLRYKPQYGAHMHWVQWKVVVRMRMVECSRRCHKDVFELEILESVVRLRVGWRVGYCIVD